MKNILLTILFLFLAVVIGGVVYIFTFDINSYKGRVEKFLFDSTGYSVAIQGKMSISKSLNPTLTIRDIEIKNATGFSEPVFFKAKKAEVSFDLIAFLKDIINVEKVELSDIDIYLQVNAAGHDNWSRIPRVQRVDNSKNDVKRPTLSKAAAVTPASQAQVDLITMNSVRINYQNEQDNIKNDLFLTKLSVDHLINLEGELLSKQEKFTFSGSVKNLVSVILKRRDLNFSFSINGLDSVSKVSGVCRDLSKCDDDITLNISSRGKNLRKVYDFFVKEPRDIPETAYSLQVAGRLFRRQMLVDGSLNLTDEGVNASYNVEQDLDSGEGKGRINIDVVKTDFVKQFGLKPFSVQANYNVVLNNMLDISNLTIMFDETDIDGFVKIDLSAKKPFVSGKLHSHYFKFSNVFERNPLVSGDNKPVVASDSLFSTKKIGLDWTDKFNADVSLTIDNFAANNLFSRYPVVVTDVSLKNGVLDARLLEGSSVAGGKVVGKLVVNATDIQNPDWNLELIGEDLMFNQFSSWKKQLLNGVLNVNLFLTAKGDTQKAIWSSLNGQALFAANQVEILSPIVADLFAENDTNGTYRASRDLFVKCSVINAAIRNGVFSLDKKAAVETSRFNMLIDGNVDFNKETINIHFMPQKPSAARYGQSVGTLRGVVLSGSLSEPKSSVEANASSAEEKESKKAKRTEMNSKKAVLDAYTTKKAVEGVSICRVAAADMKLKTIDDYYGRLPVVEPVKVEPKQVKAPEQTKAQKLGRELLNTLSDVLNDKDDEDSSN